MRHPKSWPIVVFIFLAAVAGSVMFPAYVDFVAGRPFGYSTSLPIVALAAGIALFASRFCWWVLWLWGIAALAYTAFRLSSGPFGPGDMGWPSWVNIVLQSLMVALLMAPPMLRWVAPFGRTTKAA